MSEPTLDSLNRIWQESTLTPSRFFARLPDREAAGSAVLYLLLIAIGAGGASLFWGEVSVLAGSIGPRTTALSAMDDGWARLTKFLLSPASLLIQIATVSALVQGGLRLLGAGQRGLHTTFRVFCFAQSPRILAVIPGIGEIVGFGWMLILAVVGLRAAHATSTGRAAAALALPVLVLFTILGLALASLIAGALALMPR